MYSINDDDDDVIMSAVGMNEDESAGSVFIQT